MISKLDMQMEVLRNNFKTFSNKVKKFFDRKNFNQFWPTHEQLIKEFN